MSADEKYSKKNPPREYRCVLPLESKLLPTESAVLICTRLLSGVVKLPDLDAKDSNVNIIVELSENDSVSSSQYMNIRFVPITTEEAIRLMNTEKIDPDSRIVMKGCKTQHENPETHVGVVIHATWKSVTPNVTRVLCGWFPRSGFLSDTDTDTGAAKQ